MLYPELQKLARPPEDAPVDAVDEPSHPPSGYPHDGKMATQSKNTVKIC